MSNVRPHVAEKSASYEVLKELERSAPWPRVPLTEAVDLNPKPDRNSLSDDLEVSFVPMAAVEAGTGAIDTSTVRRYAEVRRGYTYFRDGDVLFAKITPCMENGKMAVAHGLRNGIGFGSTEFHVLRPRDGVDAHYVYHFVSSRRFRAEAAHHMTGAVGQKRVPAAFLERSEIPLPPIDEQRRIAAEVEKQFSRLDEAVEDLKRVKATLKRYKAAILKAAVEGRLVSIGTGGANAWTQTTIGQIARIVGGLTKNPKRSTLRQKLPYLRVANVYANELRLADIERIGVADSELNKLLLKAGDLLIVEGNGSKDQIGRVALWDGSIDPCVHQNHLIKVRVTGSVLPKWALFWFLSPNGRRHIEEVSSSTSGLYTLSVNKVGALRIVLPPIDEQQRIVAEIERYLSVAEELEKQVETELARASRLRQVILSRAFSGAQKPTHPER